MYNRKLPFVVDFTIENGDFPIVMFNYQRWQIVRYAMHYSHYTFFFIDVRNWHDGITRNRITNSWLREGPFASVFDSVRMEQGELLAY